MREAKRALHWPAAVVPFPTHLRAPRTPIATARTHPMYTTRLGALSPLVDGPAPPKASSNSAAAAAAPAAAAFFDLGGAAFAAADALETADALRTTACEGGATVFFLEGMGERGCGFVLFYLAAEKI